MKSSFYKADTSCAVNESAAAVWVLILCCAVDICKSTIKEQYLNLKIDYN